MVKFKKKEEKKSFFSKTNSLFSNISSFFSKIKSNFFFLKWVDPFTYVDLFIMPHVKKITNNEFVELLVNVFFAGLFAFLFYSFLAFLFGVNTPLVIVYSASMEPDLYRGDIIGLYKSQVSDDYGPTIFLDQKIKGVAVNNYASAEYLGGEFFALSFSNGEKVLYQKDSRTIVYPSYPVGIPIIHRAIARIKALDGEFVLTKGDNQITNPTYDQDCGRIVNNISEKNCITFYAIPVEEIQGVAFFNIPKFGCVKLWLVDDLLHLILKGSLPSDFRGFC